MDRPVSTRLFLLILVYFIFNAVNYARVMPPFEAADEAAHFLYIHNLQKTGNLPVETGNWAITFARNPTVAWSVKNDQPPLYYALGALLISPTSREDINNYLRPNPAIFLLDDVKNNPNRWLHNPEDSSGDTATAIWILRLYSMALAAGTLWFTYLTARLLLKQNDLALAAVFLGASIPAFVSMSASVNNDNLVTLLYAAGVFVILNVWERAEAQQGAIRRVDTLALMVILPLAALAKYIGLSLVVIVVGTLIFGVWRRRFKRMAALRVAGLGILSCVYVAGWWFVRNLDRYGDLLAWGAPPFLWEIDYELAARSGDLLAELWRIWRSFWMMMGHWHVPVYGPSWVFLFAGVLGLAAFAGLWRYVRRGDSIGRQRVAILVSVCVVLIALLLTGTRSTDVASGRALYPMLVAFLPLTILGLHRLGGRLLVVVALLPFVAGTFTGWMTTLPTAYRPLTVVDALPEDVPFVGVDADDLSMLAYRIEETRIGLGDDLHLDLYFRGRSEENAALSVTAVDSMTLERLGQIAVYPGMAPTNVLDPEQIYRTSVTVPLDAIPDGPVYPRLVRVQIRWLEPETQAEVALVDGMGDALDALLLNGPTLIDNRYDVHDPRFETDVVFGDVIRLTGYTLSAGIVEPGMPVDVTLNWRTLRLLPDDWTLTVQMYNDDGILVDQVDAMLPGYPSRRWIAGIDYEERRQLTVPEDASSGQYRIVVAWYRVDESGFQRLSAVGDLTILDDLALLSPLTLPDDEPTETDESG